MHVILAAHHFHNSKLIPCSLPKLARLKCISHRELIFEGTEFRISTDRVFQTRQNEFKVFVCSRGGSFEFQGKYKHHSVCLTNLAGGCNINTLLTILRQLTFDVLVIYVNTSPQ